MTGATAWIDKRAELLSFNGPRLTATPVEAIEMIPAVAAGDLDEAGFAE